MEFIGIDIGSQATKLVLIDHKGETLAEEYFPHPIDYPRIYWAEQDPTHWETATVKGLQSICAKSKKPAEICSIGIAAQVDGIVPIDRYGKPLSNAIIWMDRRATKEEQLISKVLGQDEIFTVTGCNLDASHLLPKILWLKNHTNVFERLHKLLLPTSYMVFYLTGRFAVDYSNASSTLMYRVKDKVWDDRILREFSIDRGFLPEIGPSTQIVGKLKKEWTSYLGLPKSPDVAVGAGDEHAAFIGTGVIEEDVAFNMAGTGEVVGASSRSPLLDESRLVETHGHPSSDLWLLENPGFVSGGNLLWFKNHFCTVGDRSLSYDQLCKEAEKVPAGSEGLVFLPTLMGAKAPEWNSAAVGNIYGVCLHTTRAHFTRAIIEGSAYGMRDVIEALKKMGFNFSKMRVTGGGSRSRLWNQIKADVLNLPIETLVNPQTTALGAALIGAVSCGGFSSLKDAVADTIRIQGTYVPGDEKTEYEALYPRYRDLYFTVKPLFGKSS